MIDCHTVCAVDFLYRNLNRFRLGGGNIFSNIIWTNREFPVATVYQNGKLHALGPPDCQNGINCRPAASPGIKHIIYNNDTLVLYRNVDGTFCIFRFFGSSVIPERGDIQCTEFHRNMFQFIDFPGDAFCQNHTPGKNSDNAELLCTTVSLQNFLCNSCNGTVHGVFIHDFGFELEL